MENYQVLGLIGSLLLILGFFIMPMFYYGGMMGGYYGGPMHFRFPFFIAIPAIVLGLIGSLINDRQIGGILLLVAAVLSLPVFFGLFGISFVLLLIAGLLALLKRS